MLLIDPYGRHLGYLRLSLTEACNLACTYCLPQGSPLAATYKSKLPFSALKTILKAFSLLQFQKLRLSGGEPTIYPELLEAISYAKDLGFEQIKLTTNGLRLKNLRALKEAGLSGLNISLDTISRPTYKALCGRDGLLQVLALIEEAMDLGLSPKINSVLLKSLNGAEYPELIHWAEQKSLSLRFIELMPTASNHKFASQERILNSEIKAYLHTLGYKPENSYLEKFPGPALYYSRQAGSAHRIGLISPLSGNFCGSCNRLRVNARGELKTCLFSEGTLPLDLEDPIRCAAIVRDHVNGKAQEHKLTRGQIGDMESFRQIGG